MGEMTDTGWHPASDVPGAFWRELRGNGLGARIVALPSGAWRVLQRGSTWGASLDVDDAKRDSLQYAVNQVLRDELASGALGDVPEWAARLTGSQLAPGAFGPHPPYHYP